MAIEYKIHKYRTVETTDDRATFSWCELSSTHSPSIAGKLLSVSIECRANDGEAFTMTPCYLGVWETAENGELIRVGVSSNKATQVVETSVVWEFEETYINGRTLVLGILDKPDGNLADTVDYGLGARVKNNDTDDCYTYHKSIGKRFCTPDITFIIEQAIEVPDEPTPDDPDTPDNPDEPTPDDDESKLREVRIEEYWPLIVKNTAEFDQIAAAENPEFNNFLKCIYRALKDGFILEATEYGVERWEKMLGISPATGSSLDDRKAAILNYLSVKTPYTWRVLKQMLVGILGEDKFVMGLNNDTQELHLTFAMAVSETPMDVVEQLMERVLPMNLVVKYDYDIVALTKIIEDGLTEMLGEDKFVVEHLPAENKLVVHTDRADDTQLEAVTALLERVLPQGVEVARYNHHIEVSWRDITRFADCVYISDVLAATPNGSLGELVTSDGWWVYTLPKCDDVQGFAHKGDAPTIASKLKHLIVDGQLFGRYGGYWVSQSSCFGWSSILESVKLTNYKPTYMHNWFEHCKKLSHVDIDYSGMNAHNSRFSAIFNGCILNKWSVLKFDETLPVPHANNSNKNITLGIHVDHQNDEEVLAAISNAEAKGWTLAVQWNGTPTSGISTMDLEEIYAKVTESEYGDYTDENGDRCSLDWGHYVTDSSEYKLFFSLVEAEQYFKLKKVNENE